MIEPLIFGEKQLFGVFYPSSDFTSDKLIVVCPPFFDEYRRTYRALGEFAAACAEKGNHALRFDYSGTGDSGGVLEDISSIDEWLQDIDNAIEEGMTLSGANRVCLFGVRWGATLACLCQHDAIEKIIVWDLIKDGSNYTNWLKEVDSSLVDEHRLITQPNSVGESIEDYRMFALADSMLASMEAVQLEKTNKSITRFVSQSEQDDRFSDEDSIKVNFNRDWPADGGGLIRPMLVLKKILEYT